MDMLKFEQGKKEKFINIQVAMNNQIGEVENQKYLRDYYMCLVNMLYLA